MRINDDVELVEGLPIAYIKSIDAIAVADLHLGYESHMAKNGVFIPKANLKKILAELSKGLKETGALKIIAVGDIKNDFSGVEQDEFNELHELAEFCRRNGVELHLVKGNHDNFIDRYKGPFKFNSYQSEAIIGDYLFFHGDRLPVIPKRMPRMMISGHEHPSIGLVNGAGRNERLRCFLLGRYKRAELLVLPAISYFATGSDVNIRPKGNIMSPAIRSANVDKMRAIAIGYGSTLDFGRIGDLRGINYR